MDELLKSLSGADSESYPVASDAELAQTEDAIGRPLPPSFKRFVTEFSNGAYLLGVQEVSAVGEGNRQIGPIQDLIGFAGESGDLEVDGGGSVRAVDLVPYSLDSNGNAWCFLTGDQGPDGEYAVAYFAADNEKLYGRLKGFEDWLQRLSETEDEVIRSLYGDDTLYGELGLG